MKLERLPAAEPGPGVTAVAPIGDARSQYQRLTRWIVFSDGLSVVAAFGVAYLLSFGADPVDAPFAVVLALLPMAAAATFAMFQLYRVYRLTPAEEFRRLVLAVTVVVALVALGSFSSALEISRPWIGLSWLFSLGSVLLTRRVWHHEMGRRRIRGELTFRTLVVGTNEEGLRIARGLVPPTGFEAVGFVSTDVESGRPGGLEIVGTLDRLPDAIRQSGADCVFVASSAVATERIREVASAARRMGAELKISANIPEVLATRISTQPVAGVMAVTLHPAELYGWQAALKRTVDLVGSTVGLVLTAPLFVGLALLVRMSTPGPVLFRQERIGRRERPFSMLKFRTMVVGADAMRDQLGELNSATAPLFKVRDDPRLHRFGRWMRRWSLDELPQLWNVAVGDMSLVGPRPPLREEVERYEEWHLDRLEVRPGMTGLWQVGGRADLPFDDYVRLDLFYIENWSLSYDLFILAKTVPAVVRGKGSY